MRLIVPVTEPDQSEELGDSAASKNVVPTGELQIAAMLIRSGVRCAVKRIPVRDEPCSPDVAALPYHYRAEFNRGNYQLTVELSSSEAGKMPYPQTFLVQACLSRMLVRASADFADWRSTMGPGSLADDVAMYAAACRKARAMGVLFTADQLQQLERVTLEELGADPSDMGYR